MEKLKFPVIPTIIVFVALSFIPNPYEVAFSQASFFFVGFWLGRHVKNSVHISKKGLLIGIGILALMLTGYYWLGIGRLLQILLFPMVFLFCWLLENAKSNISIRILNFFGSISLESYILNVTLIDWIIYFNLLPNSLYSYRYLFIVIFGIILATATNRLCAPIIASLSK